ncbi:hypothetical protein HK101_004419 [Irineochytrium annulatum]|nr:hypothetical protein HK101_004419 [Irineochytrium annulatum]
MGTPNTICHTITLSSMSQNNPCGPSNPFSVCQSISDVESWRRFTANVVSICTQCASGMPRGSWCEWSSDGSFKPQGYTAGVTDDGTMVNDAAGASHAGGLKPAELALIVCSSVAVFFAILFALARFWMWSRDPARLVVRAIRDEMELAQSAGRINAEQTQLATVMETLGQGQGQRVKAEAMQDRRMEILERDYKVDKRATEVEMNRRVEEREEHLTWTERQELRRWEAQVERNARMTPAERARQDQRVAEALNVRAKRSGGWGVDAADSGCGG